MSDFSVFLPLSKVEKDKNGAVIVSGYASTETRDSDGEIIKLDAIRKALPGYMAWGNIREMHRLSAVGTAQETHIDDKGLFLKARIVDPAAAQKCLEGVYKGFSIGGRKLAKVGDKITEVDMTEISVVDRPANPDCRITIAKGFKAKGAADEGYLMKVVQRSPQDKALSKMAKAVEILAKAGPPAAHDGFSLPAGAVAKPDGVQSVNDSRPNENVTRKNEGDSPCEKHGKMGCEKCAVAKRKFSADERQQAAAGGEAMPDGSFPIKSKKDLKNAFGLRNNSKHSADDVKAHIQARAKALGLKDPYAKAEKKAAKAAKAAAIAKAVDAMFLGNGDIGAKGLGNDFIAAPAAAPAFLDLKAAPSPLVKGMGAAGDLAYTFDSLRRAQRSLMLEGQREGGDKKDQALAKRIGALAKELAAIIGQKAEHEGAEASSMSDADDQYVMQSLGKDFAMSEVNTDLAAAIVAEMQKRQAMPVTKAQRLAMARDNIKKSKDARKAAKMALEDCHKLHKAAYLAKAAKGKGNAEADAEFDHAGAMEKLQKAYGELEKMKTFMKAADNDLEKLARSGQRGQEATDGDEFFTVPAGVKDLTPDAMSGAAPGTKQSTGIAPMYPDSGQVYAGKAAVGDDLQKFVKNGQVPVEVLQLVMEKAQMEGELNALRNRPAGGPRPYSFDMTKVIGGSAGTDQRQQVDALFKGVDTAALSSNDEGTHKVATARVIGNLLTSGQFGKSVLDPTFHGTAGM